MMINETCAGVRVTRMLLAAPLCLAAVAAGLLPAIACGATFTWNNTPANNQWGTAGNWTPGGVPGSLDAVQFTNISTNAGIDLGGARTIVSLTFGGLSNYSLNNGSLTLLGASLATNGFFLPTSYSINVPIKLASSADFFTGNLSTLTVTQPITNNTVDALQKSGPGTLVLTGSDSSVAILRTLAGVFDLNGGSLAVRNTSDFGDVEIKTDTRVRNGGKLTGAGDFRIDTVGVTASVQGAGSELSTEGLASIGSINGGLLDVSDQGQFAAATLVIGGNFQTSPAPDRLTIRAQGHGVVGIANIGLQTDAVGEINVSDAGSTFTANETALGGTPGEQWIHTRGRLVVEKDASANTGDTYLQTTESKIIVDKATLTVARLQSFGSTAPRIELTNPASGKALTIAGAETAIPTFAGVIADSAAGSGGFRKVSPGAQILTGHNTFTGGTRVEEGVLQLGVGDALAPTGPVEIVGGTLDLGGFAQRIGDFKLTSGTLAGALGSTLIAGNVDVFAGSIAAPLATTAAVIKDGAGTVTATAPITADEVIVDAGVFDLQAGVKANVSTSNGAQVKLRGTLDGSLSGVAGSTTTLTGSTVITAPTSNAGLVEVGAHTLALGGAGDQVIGSTSLAGGVVVAPGTLTIGATLTGNGTVVARIASTPSIPPASIIAMGGPLTVGTMAASDSLNGYLGSIIAGVQPLTLLSSGFASLGNSTTVNGGSINSINGVQVNATKSLTGFGVVNGPLKNLGVVTGGSGANVLRFTGPVTGGGSFLGNVKFEHTYSPGASPASVTFTGDPVFASTSRLVIEIGGLAPGTQHDRLAVSGELTLGGALRVALIDGFAPEIGDAFDILDWTTLKGEFASFELPALAGMRWDISQLYTVGALSVAPLFEADFDADGRVDGADLGLWRAGFGRTLAGRADGDATGDGLVDGADFLVWQLQNGLGVSAAISLNSVPEPAAWGLAAICAPLLRRRRVA